MNQPAKFTIDTREAATQGGLGVTIEGPSEAAIDCKDNGDGTCAVAYYPKEVGDFNVNVTYDRKHIKGSPFTAKIGPEEAGIVPQQAPAPVATVPNVATPQPAAQTQAQPTAAAPNNKTKPAGPNNKTKGGPNNKAKPAGQAQAQPQATKPNGAGAPGSKNGKKKPVDTGKIKVTGNGIQPQGRQLLLSCVFLTLKGKISC